MWRGPAFAPFKVDKTRNVIDHRCARRGIRGVGIFENLTDSVEDMEESLRRDPVDQVDEGAVRHRIENLAARSLQLLIINNFRNRRIKELEYGLDGDAQGRVVVPDETGRTSCMSPLQ